MSWYPPQWVWSRISSIIRSFRGARLSLILPSTSTLLILTPPSLSLSLQWCRHHNLSPLSTVRRLLADYSEEKLMNLAKFTLFHVVREKTKKHNGINFHSISSAHIVCLSGVPGLCLQNPGCAFFPFPGQLCLSSFPLNMHCLRLPRRQSWSPGSSCLAHGGVLTTHNEEGMVSLDTLRND
jgi:hypothetical protein